MEKKHVIIDCDPGADDALALMLALNSEELIIHGVTVVAGNRDVDKCAQNALKVLEHYRKTEIPVARGAEKPLKRSLCMDDIYSCLLYTSCSAEINGIYQWGYSQAVYDAFRDCDSTWDCRRYYSGGYLGRGSRRGIDFFFRRYKIQLCSKPVVCLSVFSAVDWGLCDDCHGAGHIGYPTVENFGIY